MNKENDTHRIRRRLESVRQENRRLRERVESLASQNHHLRERLAEVDGIPPEVSAFEDIGSPSRGESTSLPKPIRPTSQEPLAWYIEAWSRTFENGISPLDPSPGLRCVTSHRAPIRIGVQLFNCDGEAILSALSKVEARQIRDRDFIPVFITDSTDFAPFRSRGYVVEYVPPSIAAASNKRGVRKSLLQDRLRLLAAKWNFDEIVDLSS